MINFLILKRLLLLGLMATSIALPAANASEEPVSPLPQDVQYQWQLAMLGKKLFFDPILSIDKSTSCSTCHDFQHGGADNQSVSTGIQGKTGHMNAPTVYNVRYNFAQFWNARIEDLEQQVLLPVQNPIELGLSIPVMVQRINDDAEYRSIFKKLFDRSPVTEYQIALALAEFQKALVTPNAKFDQFLRGEIELSEDESTGYELFKSLGCVSCHNGRNLGGSSLQKIGAIYPYRYNEAQDDRFRITGKEQDKNRFRVPSLRNVALTAPYFHDGSISNLRAAVVAMGYHNLGLSISNDQVEKIVAFLHTLTGETPAIVSHHD